MDFLTVGGDARFAWMAHLAGEAGLEAAALGAERADVPGLRRASLNDIGRSDVLVMPSPFEAGGLRAPLAEEKIDARALLERAPAGVPLALFGPGEAPRDVRAAHPIWDLSADEALMGELARMTAEGAIHAACERALFELHGARVMLLGYGRIARALHDMLRGCGARVSVAARKGSAREEAAARGALAVDFDQAEALLPRAQMIFSTPPARVLDARRISLIRPGTLIVDLSSPPYGVDLTAAQARCLDAWREPGLPGRYCPASAGRAMLDALLRRKGAKTDERA